MSVLGEQNFVNASQQLWANYGSGGGGGTNTFNFPTAQVSSIQVSSIISPVADERNINTNTLTELMPEKVALTSNNFTIPANTTIVIGQFQANYGNEAFSLTIPGLTWEFTGLPLPATVNGNAFTIGINPGVGGAEVLQTFDAQEVYYTKGTATSASVAYQTSPVYTYLTPASTPGTPVLVDIFVNNRTLASLALRINQPSPQPYMYITYLGDRNSISSINAQI